jgi:L-2,4-diaminobutyrate decarboxylase
VRLVTDLALGTARRLPVVPNYTDLPGPDRDALFPDVGAGIDAAWSTLGRTVLDTAVNVSSPAYAAHYLAPPLIASVAAEVAVGALNQSLDSWDQGPSAALLETAIVSLACGELGLAGGDGLFTSGASLSNLMGLMLARELRGGDGLQVVCSADVHHSVTLACRVLGLHREAVIAVPVDGSGAMDRTACVDTLRRAAERSPGTAVVVTAGTTGRGAIDPIEVVADEIDRLGRDRFWLHADAAGSGPLAFSRRHRHLVAGLALVDSVALDFHKIGWQTVSSGLFLVRERTSLDAIRHHDYYLNPDDEPDDRNLAWKSLQTTRRFDALKLAITLLALGRDGFDELIDRQQRAVESVLCHLRSSPEITVVATGLHTVVFRYDGSPPLAPDVADGVNDRLRTLLASTGEVVLGRTTVDGTTALKFQILNPCVDDDTAARLVAAVVDTGRILAGRAPT